MLDVYVAREDPDPEVTGALVADAVPLPAGAGRLRPRPRRRARRPRRPGPGPATWCSPSEPAPSPALGPRGAGAARSGADALAARASRVGPQASADPPRGSPAASGRAAGGPGAGWPRWCVAGRAGRRPASGWSSSARCSPSRASTRHGHRLPQPRADRGGGRGADRRAAGPRRPRRRSAPGSRRSRRSSPSTSRGRGPTRSGSRSPSGRRRRGRRRRHAAGHGRRRRAVPRLRPAAARPARGAHDRRRRRRRGAAGRPPAWSPPCPRDLAAARRPRRGRVPSTRSRWCCATAGPWCGGVPTSPAQKAEVLAGAAGAHGAQAYDVSVPGAADHPVLTGRARTRSAEIHRVRSACRRGSPRRGCLVSCASRG